jgi:hypothetical protein
MVLENTSRIPRLGSIALNSLILVFQLGSASSARVNIPVPEAILFK